jgi:hypothetical protein
MQVGLPLSRESIARGCSGITNSFVCLCVNNHVRVQHRNAAAACGLLNDASFCSERNTGTPQVRLNWKGTSHWNSFAAGQRTAPIWLDKRQVFVLPRATTWYWLCEANQRTLPRAAPAANWYSALGARCFCISLWVAHLLRQNDWRVKVTPSI